MKPWHEGGGLGVSVVPPLKSRARYQQKRRNPIFWASIVGMFIAAAIALVLLRERIGLAPKQPLTSLEARKQARACEAKGNIACAESVWRNYIRVRPEDEIAVMHLAILLRKADRHADAIVLFESLLNKGSGNAFLFTYYASSLGVLGRKDDAIRWFYKALAVAPTLGIARSQLAKLLTSEGRYYEALSVLSTMEADARGRPTPHAGQRIAIESLIQESAAKENAAAPSILRVPASKGHFWVPVILGDGRSVDFMVDTGASHTAISEEFLRTSKVAYEILNSKIQMITADGKKTPARMVLIASLKVGPFQLRNVKAISCVGCLRLLGQSALSQFDLRSEKNSGIEFLTLSRRK